MTKDKARSLDEFPGGGAVTTGSCLPDGFISWFPNNGVLIEVVGLGGIGGRSEKICVAVAKPRRRMCIGLGLFFNSFVDIRETRADEGAEQAATHRLLGVIKVITRD